MFSGDSKEASKDYTLCSMKANEQEGKHEGKVCYSSAPAPLPVPPPLKYMQFE